MSATIVLFVKAFHVILAILSGLGFALRGVWMLMDSPRRKARWVRIAPHVLDTFLLLSGIGLAAALGLSPAAHPWFGVKLVLLVIYIVSGSVALKRGRTLNIRIAALVIALAAFGLMVASAITHRPLGII